MPPADPPACELLEWDTAHFGFPVAQVTAAPLTEAEAAAIDGWCERRGVRCLYLRTDPNDAPSARVAAAVGFHFVDAKLILRHDLEGLGERPWRSPGPAPVREATEADLPAVRGLAARSHHATRFYFDEEFDRERCDRLYELWAERGLRDPERSLLVLEADGEIAGYQVVRRPGADGVGALELIAIAEPRRGRGLGVAQLRSSLRLLREAGADSVTTQIQARNAGSVRVHERIGFLTEGAQIWHHKWFDVADGS